MINRTTRMLNDGVSMGGSPTKVGQIASEYALTVGLLRAKRQVTSSTFSYLSIPLHTAMVGLMVFILEIVESFSTRLTVLTEELLAQGTTEGGVFSLSSLPMFQSRDMGLIGMVTLAVIVALTISNALAPKFATGAIPQNMSSLAA